MKKKLLLFSLAVCFIAVNIIGAKSVMNGGVTIGQLTDISTVQAEGWGGDGTYQTMGWCSEEVPYDMTCMSFAFASCTCDCCVYTGPFTN